jgi:hypothetical protein
MLGNKNGRPFALSLAIEYPDKFGAVAVRRETISRPR